MRICQVGTLESLTSSEIDAPTVDVTWRECRGCLARRAVGRRTVRGASDVHFHAVRKRFIAISLLIMAAAATGAQTPATDLETIGPKVGTRVASFTLPDQNGQARSLESLIGPKGAILVFFRSADW